MEQLKKRIKVPWLFFEAGRMAVETLYFGSAKQRPYKLLNGINPDSFKNPRKEYAER
jgi:hypothetical protein